MNTFTNEILTEIELSMLYQAEKKVNEKCNKLFVIKNTKKITIINFILGKINIYELEYFFNKYFSLKEKRRREHYHFKIHAIFGIAYNNLEMPLFLNKYNTCIKFKKRIDFLKARNSALGKVTSYNNYKNLFELLQERISNDDYGYLNEAIVSGRRNKNLLIYAIIKKFNILCLWLQFIKY